MRRNTEIEVRLPKTINDLRIRHLRAFSDESFKADSITLNAKVIFLANISLVSVGQLMTIHHERITEMFNHCMGLFADYKLNGNPKDFLTINGIEYQRVDIKKVGIGYHIDCSKSDFDKDPVRLACINYIPKGTIYGELDENENLKYPISSRYEDFKEHFKMTDFVELHAFFLLKVWSLIDIYTEKEKIEKKLKRVLKIFGNGTK
ncbi:hypothetical protein UFOVP514_55 [uncultured Caudovirales phage]|uniref:Uncharacterized protein n=1 Tax=uncultured Caudovirales phage TaxID=2100421 RepID=A0A6J5MNJ6_9CAUD|nr:hypothetical protein UFOVP514_55 [uncultured Caudovirales phage]